MSTLSICLSSGFGYLAVSVVTAVLFGRFAAMNGGKTHETSTTDQAKATAPKRFAVKLRRLSHG